MPWQGQELFEECGMGVSNSEMLVDRKRDALGTPLFWKVSS